MTNEWAQQANSTGTQSDAHHFPVVERQPLQCPERIRGAWHAVKDHPGLPSQLRRFANDDVQHSAVCRERQMNRLLHLCERQCVNKKQTSAKDARQHWKAENSPSFFVFWFRFCTYTVWLGTCIATAGNACGAQKEAPSSVGFGRPLAASMRTQNAAARAPRVSAARGAKRAAETPNATAQRPVTSLHPNARSLVSLRTSVALAL